MIALSVQKHWIAIGPVRWFRYNDAGVNLITYINAYSVPPCGSHCTPYLIIHHGVKLFTFHFDKRSATVQVKTAADPPQIVLIKSLLLHR